MMTTNGQTNIKPPPPSANEIAFINLAWMQKNEFYLIFDDFINDIIIIRLINVNFLYFFLNKIS